MRCMPRSFFGFDATELKSPTELKIYAQTVLNYPPIL